MRSIEERFWEKVDTSEICWEWMGCKSHGYGQIRLNGKMIQAHRVAYYLTYGGVPEGMLVCHHCDNPSCVRPSHLFTGTDSDNMRDSVIKGRRFDNQGEKHNMVKLCANDVYEIRRLHYLGVKQALLAKMFDCDCSNINHIVHRRRWRHI